ncbi:MAG: ribosomal protein [Patescibacteria group bacterium]|jgi:ribosomal protein S6|nr:ribosomal protein [Patescibacteria group bacterium]
MTDEQEIVGTEADMEDSRIYEAAFHIVPSLDEAGAAAEVADIKKFLVSNGATILGSGEPMLMELAYEIQKDIDRKRHTFTRAYFAWFVFEASPEAAHAVKEMLGARLTLVRSLLIKTSKEAASDRRHPALLATPSNEAPVVEEPVEVEEAPVAADEEKKPMDVEVVDAEIAKLVVE